MNWEHVPTAALAVQMTLASHLNPTAVLRLSLDPQRDLSSAAPRSEESDVLERAGWLRALNDEHDPFMTDNHVRTVRYDQVRFALWTHVAGGVTQYDVELAHRISALLPGGE